MKYKKIAIISDIHAQLDALDTFLNYLEQEEIQLVFNLGDFISSGPNPCEVFDKIIGDKRFINIKGYDEEKLFDVEKGKAGIGEGEWLIHKLGPERLKLLRGIPSIKAMTINYKRFLLCHHNGWSDLAQLEAHTRGLKDKRFEYIAYGGSHAQELSHARDSFYYTNIIDPGTLGLGQGNRGYLAIIEFEKQEAIIKFQSLEIQQQEKRGQKLIEGEIVQEECILMMR